nr:hypothetical protein [Tanacetum cinerariifolium]
MVVVRKDTLETSVLRGRISRMRELVEILEIQGERPKKDRKLLSCIKAEEKRPEDIRIANTNIFEQPKKSLILPLKEVNAETSTDKSLCGTAVRHGAQPKATTDKRSKKKRNPPSSKPRTSKPVRESYPLKKVTNTQP